MPQRFPPFLLVALLALSLAPALVVRLPAMVDYPNHLARITILARAGGEDANPFYFPAWSFMPNVALDALAPPLARVAGAETATKLFLLVAQALVFAGACALEAAVKGRLRFAPFAAAAFMFNTAFGLGFLNFQFGFGLALLALAAWIALERAGAAARLVFVVVAEPLLFGAHLFALGMFGFVAGCALVGKVAARRIALEAAAAEAATLAAPASMLALVAVGAGEDGRTLWRLGPKLSTLFLSFSAADVWLSRVDAAFVFAVLIGVAVTGRWRWVGSGAFVIGGLTLLFLALPTKWRGGDLVDLRALTALMFVAPAFVHVDFDVVAARRAAAAAALFAIVNVAVAGAVWLSVQSDLKAIVASFEKLPPRAKVLVAFTREGELPDPMRHAPTLAAGFGDAFVADLFAFRGQQPLAARPDVAALVTPQQTGTPSLARLIKADASPATPPQLRAWRENFDALYVIGPRTENPDAAALSPLASGDRFDLYRIARR